MSLYQIIIALLNRGACWQGHNAQHSRCTLY